MRFIVIGLVSEDVSNYVTTWKTKLKDQYGLMSSKLPPHITLLPICEDEQVWNQLIASLHQPLFHKAMVNVSGLSAFEQRVIYLSITTNPSFQQQYYAWLAKLGVKQAQTLHITIAHRKLEPHFQTVWQQLSQTPCTTNVFAMRDVCVYVWQAEQWQLYGTYPQGG
ncbi:MAG: 2'-5' RNA ligase family protein [Erysipelotrichaceae bacterium]